ncbi:tectonin beta-propeller repeat-containing protein 2 isoform X2 [Gouania willdenowi]|uniref:tectonin beta-propeller repeat-containing protein 2 isoform X2 n=1 Tax=Gouania willdenowi TaxID=441366 RepID=UPI001054F965|nr:tectonin beta-propeller repeat-containing protein 2 isoform X2 [Gouania willdenowi]
MDPQPVSVLREFCPLHYLTSSIPAKVQRGFKSVLVYLTALDCSTDFLALGSSTGMIYLYCRHLAQLNKYSLEGKCGPVSAVKLLSCFDDLVAVGTASGQVTIFQLVSPLPGRNKQLRRFDVTGLHRGSVTSLAWSTNGMKLFSGDDRGRVVFSALDLDQGVCKPQLLMEESSAVVQLEYKHQVLLVSTQHKKLLYCTQTQEVLQLGDQSQHSGRFGACFLPALCKQSDVEVFAAGPDLKLWRADVRGRVKVTQQLRALFHPQVPQIELFPRPGSVGGFRPSEPQLGLISCFLSDALILSWNEYSLYVVDCVRQEVVGALESSGDIVSVSCCNNEIFVLKGDRDVIRLSDSPEGITHTSLKLSIGQLSPLTPPSVDQPMGSVEMAQPIRTVPIEVEGQSKKEEAGLSDDEQEEAEQVGDSFTSSCSAPQWSEQPPQELELVVKAVRLKKKRRRRTDSGPPPSESSDAGSDHVSLGGSENHQDPVETLTEVQSSTSLLLLDPLTDPVLDSVPDPEVKAGALTPDVDLLLSCSFSYMKNCNEEHQPMDEQDPTSSPLIGPKESEQETLPSAGHMDQSSDEERDIYSHRPISTTEGGHTHTSPSNQCVGTTERPTDLVSESWSRFTGPGCGILSLQATDRYVWCLDFKGGLFFSVLPQGNPLLWQRFEENVQQVAVSPSGELLWKVEQRVASACAKVCVRGKRHWYKAQDQTNFVALSDDSAWIIRTNGDLYLQTGLSVERPCSLSVKLECPCLFTQVCVRSGVVWALSEHRTLFYREGLSTFCSEGDGWRSDTVSEAQGLDLMCVALAEGGVAWALDSGGSLWFRTGVSASRPQGEDDHWWQISISDYVVFDQGSLFQTLLQATQSVASVTKAPVERVVAFLSQYSQCQPSLVSANSSGVWVASGRNQLHLARGSLVGTFWQNVVPRGTVSATRWTFITSSAVPHREGAFLWLAQSRKDLFCVWDQDGELRPSSIALPPQVELLHLSSCPDALWGLDAQGQVFIRPLTPSCPTGLDWTQLDLSQLGSVRLQNISCGSQNVWAVDSKGLVYFRVGTQPLNSSMMLPAWILIDPPPQPIGVQLVSIQTSPNDGRLWALDNRGGVYVRNGLSHQMPVGTDWECVPGVCVHQMVLSSQTVWARCSNGEMCRRYGVSEKNPGGDYWKKIPGTAAWFTVTTDEDLWAVTLTGGLSRRLTKLLLQTGVSPTHAGPTLGDPEEEWEVI